MSLVAFAPGVDRRASAPPRATGLVTGVPGFVGFIDVAVLESLLFGGATGVVRLDGPDDLGGKLAPAAGSYLGQAVRGFFANGGSHCYVAGTADMGADALIAALAALESVAEIDLVAAPDTATLGDMAAAVRVQRALLAHAGQRRRFALLDAAPGSSTAMVTAQRAAIVANAAEPIDGALYYPWLKNGDGQLAPPSGHVAGIVARTDATAGVARAPAGGAIADAIDVELGVDGETQAGLNAAGINCLRAFPGRGARVWGARTLSGDPAWTNLNVRRLFLTLARWIDANLGWTVFEPNAPATWARVERVLKAHLTELWRANALTGAKAEEAFFVRCDAATNAPAGRDAGGMVVELGLAPAAPAEFLTVRLDLEAQAA